MARQQYRCLQGGRAFAALIVVLQHLGYFAGAVTRFWNRPQVFRDLTGTTLGVEFFFVLSGVVIMMAHWSEIGQPSSVGIYAWKRFRRIYPIYWIVVGGWFLTYLRFGTVHDPAFHDPAVIVSNILLVHLFSLSNLLGVAWTLYHEILFYAVFALLLLHRRLGMLVLILWSAASVIALFFPSSEWLGDYLFSPLHLLFVLGMLAEWLIRKHRTPLPWAFLFGGITIFLGAILVAARGWDNIWIREAGGFGAFLIILGAMELERQGRLSTPKALVFLGNASFSIYLVHGPVLAAVVNPVFRMTKTGTLPFIAAMSIMFFVAISCGCLVYLFIERPILRRLGGFRHSAKGRLAPAT